LLIGVRHVAVLELVFQIVVWRQEHILHL
jgi:hypothetical protein